MFIRYYTIMATIKRQPHRLSQYQWTEDSFCPPLQPRMWSGFPLSVSVEFPPSITKNDQLPEKDSLGLTMVPPAGALATTLCAGASS